MERIILEFDKMRGDFYYTIPILKKSFLVFIRKYWVYILNIKIALIMNLEHESKPGFIIKP